MTRNQLMVPRHLTVKLDDKQYMVKGTYNNYKFNEVRIKRVSNSRVYFTAIYNGTRMVEVAKQMKFEQGRVYVKFGSTKVVIGTYTEIFN